MRNLTQRAYHSYLIRLWMDDRGAWRASAEEPARGERWTFTDFDSLVRFLRAAMDAGPEVEDQDA